MLPEPLRFLQDDQPQGTKSLCCLQAGAKQKDAPAQSSGAAQTATQDQAMKFLEETMQEIAGGAV